MYPSSFRMRAISVFSLETGTSTRWCLAAAALRRRVRKSAMGSVCIVLLNGLLPARFHDAGDFSAQRHAAKTDSAHLELADISAGPAANAAAVANAYLELRLLVRLGDLCCACHLLRYPFFAKWNPEPFQQLATLLIVLRAGRQRDVHALDLVHARVIDLRKHELVLQSQGVIPAAVEGIRRQTPEVAHAWQHHIAQAVEKFVHVVAAQRHRAADGHASANLEVRDGLLRPRDHGFLPRDLAEFLRRGVQQLHVLAGFAHPDVNRDFLQLGHSHYVLPAKALHQRGHGLTPVFFLQSALHGLTRLFLYLSNVALQCRQLRTLVPSGRTVWPMRVCLPQLPQTTITFETLIPASFSMIPPLMFFEGLGRVCRLMMPTCSTTTVFFAALTESTRPLLPASLPAITFTLSPLRIWIVCRSALSCLSVMAYQTSGASETILVNFFSRNSRATGPNTRVPTGSPASLISTAALSSNRMYVPSLRRRSFLIRTTTAFTTLPFLTWLSGVASFTAAVMTSPRPACNPASPPTGIMHVSLRAPELSATVSQVRI